MQGCEKIERSPCCPIMIQLTKIVYSMYTEHIYDYISQSSGKILWLVACCYRTPFLVLSLVSFSKQNKYIKIHNEIDSVSLSQHTLAAAKTWIASTSCQWLWFDLNMLLYWWCLLSFCSNITLWTLKVAWKLDNQSMSNTRPNRLFLQ